MLNAMVQLNLLLSAAAKPEPRVSVSGRLPRGRFSGQRTPGALARGARDRVCYLNLETAETMS